jgi:endonuclease YncB( thermonuclease family)
MPKSKNSKSYKIAENPKQLETYSTATPYFSFNDEVHLAKIVKCYDGDSIYCVFKHNKKYQKFKIRMDGYDSPEMKPSRKLDDEVREDIKRRAKLAKKRIEELILDKNVYLFCHGFDKYGRILGTVKINLDDSATVNEIMVEEGHGYLYEGGTKKIEQLPDTKKIKLRRFI